MFCSSSQLYSKAISAAPGVASYYGNRAAAWLMVGAAKECATDCRRAIQLDSGYVKGYVRLAKALIELSDVDGKFIFTFVWAIRLTSCFVHRVRWWRRNGGWTRCSRGVTRW